jgi:hypothetical protein
MKCCGSLRPSENGSKNAPKAASERGDDNRQPRRPHRKPKQAGQARRQTSPFPVPERASLPAGWPRHDEARAKVPASVDAGSGTHAAATVQPRQQPEARAGDPQAEEAEAQATSRAA